MKRILMILVMFFVVFSGGCTTPRDYQPAADQLMKKIHAYWQHEQWGPMLASYDHVFFANQGKAVWEKKLLSYHESLGHLKSTKLISSQVDARYSGDFYIYSFRLYFERGDLREVLTIYKPLNVPRVGIVGHVLTKVKGL